jgi:hypothetical protein
VAARAGLQQHGVDCGTVQLTSQGRMGLYFLEPGAGLRASSIGKPLPDRQMLLKKKPQAA